jgi:hypothetical protein
LNFAAYADNQIMQKSISLLVADANPMRLQLSDKLCARNTIFRRMSEECAIEPTLQGLFGHFLKIKPAVWFQDARNFLDGILLDGNVMNDAEVKDRVISGSRRVIFFGVADSKP